MLIERGYKRVRPLTGGLDAWVDAGYEVVEEEIAS
jgi:rhodanese-related sulfurtransferase